MRCLLRHLSANRRELKTQGARVISPTLGDITLLIYIIHSGVELNHLVLSLLLDCRDGVRPSTQQLDLQKIILARNSSDRHKKERAAYRRSRQGDIAHTGRYRPVDILSTRG